MTDRQLEELGVKAMGDRLRIRAFCERKSQTAAEQKKRQDAVEKLKSMLSHQRASKRSHGRDTLEKKEKKVTKTAIKFEFGWKHWCQEAKTYKQKKKGSGGGTRVLEVPKVACAHDCLEMAKELVFPLGISPEGSLDEMDLTLGGFSGCVMLVTSTSMAICSLSLSSDTTRQLVLPSLDCICGQQKSCHRTLAMKKIF